MYTLVIVDDELELLDGLSKFFPWESIGFKVVGAFSNAQSALRFCTEERVDVVFTDIRMPFMSGLELIEEISKRPHPPLFCIMSAYDDFAYAKQAISYGVQDYLVKPASFEEIRGTFEKIAQHLNGEMPPVAANTLRTITNPLIAQTITIMEKQIRTCTLQHIAGSLGVTTSYLSRLFKEEVEENFQDYLLRLKMEAARHMLLGTIRYKNKEIAYALGYQDTQNFCRTFRKYFGKSPQKYRQEEQE